jgi:glycosyltransferase involved in cell wall biosynthesis
METVLIYGDDGFATGGGCYGRAFERAGYRAVLLGEGVGLGTYRSNLALRIFKRAFARVRETDRLAHVRLVFEEIRRHRPSIVVALGGKHLAFDEVNRIREGGAFVVNVNHDDFFSRYRSNWTWTQRRAIPAYDHILTTRTVNVDEIRLHNPNVSFFPFAYDPEIHRPVPVSDGERETWASDVVFVGTWATQRARLLETLVTAVPARYSIYGAGWERLARSSPLRPSLRGIVWGDDMSRALGGGKIALGFLRKENRDEYTQRTFEIPACGGLLLAERTETHHSLFRDGVEAVFFDPDDPAELIRSVRALLADEPRRESIRAAGRAAVTRGNHSYDDRIRDVLTLATVRRGTAARVAP